MIEYRPEDAKSISREVTFQEDTDNYRMLDDVLVLLALSVEERARRQGLHGKGVTLKLTYSDMQSITRSKAITTADIDAAAIYRETSRLLEQVEKRPVRLVGAGIYNLSTDEGRQMTLDDYLKDPEEDQEIITRRLEELHERYGLDFVGHLEDIYHGRVLYRTIEYMRKHFNG